MILVATSLAYSAELLPQFVAHYAAMGANRVGVLLVPIVDGIEAVARKLVSDSPIPVDFVPMPKSWSALELPPECVAAERVLRQCTWLSNLDWVIYADLDEFHHPDLAAVLHDPGDMDVVRGEFEDCVAASGELAPFNPDLSLDAQYSVHCDLSKRLGFPSGKVLVARAGRTVNEGHHTVIVQDDMRVYPRSIPVRHYCWRAGRIEQLERRYAYWASRNVPTYRQPWVRLLRQLRRSGGKVWPLRDDLDGEISDGC